MVSVFCGSQLVKQKHTHINTFEKKKVPRSFPLASRNLRLHGLDNSLFIFVSSQNLPCEMTIAGIRNVSFTKTRYIPPLQLHKRRGLPRRVGIDPHFWWYTPDVV